MKKTKNYETLSTARTNRPAHAAARSAAQGAQTTSLLSSPNSNRNNKCRKSSVSPNSSPQSSPQHHHRRRHSRRLSSCSDYDDCDDSPFHLLTLSGITVALIVGLTIAVVDGWLFVNPAYSERTSSSVAATANSAGDAGGKNVQKEQAADVLGDVPDNSNSKTKRGGFFSFLNPYSFLSLIGESHQAPVGSDGKEIKLLPAVSFSSLSKENNKETTAGHQQKMTKGQTKGQQQTKTAPASGTPPASSSKANEDFNAKRARIKEKVKSILADGQLLEEGESKATCTEASQKPRTNELPSPLPASPIFKNTQQQHHHESFLDDESTQVYMLDQEQPYEEAMQTETIFRCWEECNKRNFCVNFSVRLTDNVDGYLVCVLSSKEKFSRATVLAERDQQQQLIQDHHQQQQQALLMVDHSSTEDPLLTKSEDEELRLKMLNEYLATGSLETQADGQQRAEPAAAKKTSGFFTGPPVPFYPQQTTTTTTYAACGCY